MSPTGTGSSRTGPPGAGARHRVILVREWDSQHTGSGCCGTLGGFHVREAAEGRVGSGDVRDGEASTPSGGLMEGMGAVYRALRRELGDAVEIEVCDPRNTAWLVPTVWRDARRGGASRGEAWRAVRRGTANGAVVVDGRVLSTGPPPPPAEAVTAVMARLAEG